MHMGLSPFPQLFFILPIVAGQSDKHFKTFAPTVVHGAAPKIVEMAQDFVGWERFRTE